MGSTRMIEMPSVDDQSHCVQTISPHDDEQKHSLIGVGFSLVTKKLFGIYQSCSSFLEMRNTRDRGNNYTIESSLLLWN